MTFAENHLACTSAQRQAYSQRICTTLVLVVILYNYTLNFRSQHFTCTGETSFAFATRHDEEWFLKVRRTSGFPFLETNSQAPAQMHCNPNDTTHSQPQLRQSCAPSQPNNTHSFGTYIVYMRVGTKRKRQRLAPTTSTFKTQRVRCNVRQVCRSQCRRVRGTETTDDRV